MPAQSWPTTPAQPDLKSAVTLARVPGRTPSCRCKTRPNHSDLIDDSAGLGQGYVVTLVGDPPPVREWADSVAAAANEKAK